MKSKGRRRQSDRWSIGRGEPEGWFEAATRLLEVTVEGDELLSSGVEASDKACFAGWEGEVVALWGEKNGRCPKLESYSDSSASCIVSSLALKSLSSSPSPVDDSGLTCCDVVDGSLDRCAFEVGGSG